MAQWVSCGQYDVYRYTKRWIPRVTSDQWSIKNASLRKCCLMPKYHDVGDKKAAEIKAGSRRRPPGGGWMGGEGGGRAQPACAGRNNCVGAERIHFVRQVVYKYESSSSQLPQEDYRYHSLVTQQQQYSC